MIGAKMISAKTVIISSLTLSTLLLGACVSSKNTLEDARYWQRASASSALYLNGPKAQQMLHSNIASCTAEIKELQRLGEIRQAIPAKYVHPSNEAERMAQQDLNQWETPERDGYLRSEHLEYHDFETCMVHHGWERAEYLPYDEASKARADYKQNQSKSRKKSNSGDREFVKSVPNTVPKPASYGNVND